MPALACEELALRARADLDAGDARLAALATGLALEAGLAELPPSERRTELEGLAGGARAAAAAALRGQVGAEGLAAVGHALERLEAALRARASDL